MRSIVAAGLATLLALACAKPLPVEAPLSVSPLTFGPSEQLKVDQAIALTDASGTMYMQQTFPRAKAMTQTFVAALPNGSYSAGLIGFGGSDRITAPLAPLDRAKLASTADSLRILGDIDGMGGRTPYHHVFPEVQGALAGKRGEAAIVIFSDGLPDFADEALVTAQAQIADYSGQTCIHTVQTGNDPTGAAFLALLSGLTPCGSARTADSVRDASAYMAFMRQVFAGPADRMDPMTGDPCEDVVRLRGIEFDFDKADIRPDSSVVLDVAIERLQACPALAVRIDGHTDWTGPEAYNQGLSERRAASVKQYFVEKGVSSRRLTTKGLGESDPIASNETRDGRAQNRRVELHPAR